MKRQDISFDFSICTPRAAVRTAMAAVLVAIGGTAYGASVVPRGGNTSAVATRPTVSRANNAASRMPAINANIQNNATAAEVVSAPEPTPEAEPEPASVNEVAPEPEPIIIENKADQFGASLSTQTAAGRDTNASNLADMVRRQRAALDAQSASGAVQSAASNALTSGQSACDIGLRDCMKQKCGTDYSKCAGDGDTIWGDKMDACRRNVTCTGHQYSMFSAEIKADRDMNAKLASYNKIISCGNEYNDCIVKECGVTYSKCLGKTVGDAAISKCSTIAKNCTQQDSGLASRTMNVFATLRQDAEKQIVKDEQRLYQMRDKMRSQCQRFGALFDDRSLVCVYTVNFFAGNSTTPTASKKLYAGSSFDCTPDWFGIDVTTFKENAYRLTRSQTSASSALLGSGLGQAVGAITSGAIGDAAKKTGSAIGGAATSAWNGTKNFVSGIFKGAEPCNDDATKKLKDANKCPSDTDAKCTDSLVEKTKLDTKQSGTDGQADENGTNKSGTCVVSKCIKGYTVNSTKTGCDKSEGDCTDTAQAQDSNATAGELKKGKCIITECGYGYHPDDDGTKCEQAELSEKGSQEKVDDLKKNAQAMKDKEQSLANRTLSAAAIGTTGIGGMNLLSGMAEQSADEDAERDMKAYLATFACDYGQGRNIKGGEKNIETPGGNDLIAQVTEYRTLAADLKVRKEALGKQPGIESEVIYDIAETGLYDNVGMGRQSGAYTSLSRALTDETSKDAEEWAKQKADTADKVKTGAITAGAGAIGGLIGNLAINSGEKKKNQLNDILNNREYDKFKKLEPVLEKLESNIPPQKENIDKCVGNATGTPPNCKCTGNLIYSAEQGCIPCGQNEELNKTGDACICKDGFSGTPCEKNPLTPKCTLTEENRSNVDIDSETGECKCVNGYPDVPTCACNITDGKYTYENGQCNKTVSERPAPKAELKGAKSMFAVNSSNLTDDAKKALDSFIVSFQEWKEENSPASYCIKIDGHTDLTGSKKYNDNLSQKRADSVKNYLTQKSLNPTYIKAQGHGWAACVDSNGKKLTPKDQPDCRKIVVEVDNKNCDGTGTSDSSDTNIPTNTNNTITSTTPSSTKPSQASTSTTDHTSKAPVEYTLDSADPTDNWPQYVKDKIANIDAAKKAGQYCNGYNQNGIQGHFIFDADYTNPPLMAPHVKAYCIFTKQSKGNLTVSSDNLLSDKAFYNGERYQFSNAAFATAPAPSALKTPLADKYVYIDMPVFSDKTSAKAGWAEKIADKRIGYVYIIMTK